MTGTFDCSAPTTCGERPGSTPSPGSGDGTWHCDSPGGPLECPSGPDPVPASRSAWPGSGEGSPTTGTSGLSGSGSSASADLQSSLESRLRVLLASCGSTLFRLTWRERATPSGRPICALRASARRTPGSDCTSSPWATPTARDWRNDRARKRKTGHPLTWQLYLCGWPTPTSSLADKGVRSEEGAVREAMRTRGPDLAA